MNGIKNTLTEGDKAGAGLPYLYRSSGLPSEVFEVRMSRDIDENLLNMAILDAVKRFPYFSVRFEERAGDFYAVYNELPLKAHHTEGFVPLGGHSNDYHLMGFTFFGKTLKLSFHHGLTDGRGAKKFLETVVNYYCEYLCASSEQYDAIKSAHDDKASEISADEMADPCTEKYKIGKSAGKIDGLSGKGYRLPEISHKSGHRRYELKFSQEEFMSKCKEINASPVIYLSMLVSRAVRKTNPECGAPIVSNFPMDARSVLGCDETFKNCVKSMTLPYGEKELPLSDTELAAFYKKLLAEQKNRDYCAKEFNTINMLISAVSHFHSVASRKLLLGFMENLSLDTYLISYVGRFNMPENLVEEIHLYSNCSDGLVLNMTCQNGYFVIDMVQDFISKKYVNAVSEMFSSNGINVQVSGEIEFETPCDELCEIITSPSTMKNLMIAIAKESTAKAKEQERKSLSYSAVMHCL